jgi:5-methylcytosine-specific restriction endonuclease McrA
MAFSTTVKQQAYNRSGGRCECRRKDHQHAFGRCLKYFLSVRSAEFHHKHASSLGGGDGMSNCEVLCPACHQLTKSYGRH